MKHFTWPSCGVAALAAVITALAALSSQANDITMEWAAVKPPPVPDLKPATIEPKTTALLILDLMKTNCGARPRCGATVPNIKKLLDAARAHDMMVFYTLVGGTPTPEGMIDQSLAPRTGEWVVRGGADKFIGSDLEQRLKDKGIKTVIVTGTSAQGAVVGTSNGAPPKARSSAPATALCSAATRLSCRLTECRRKTPTTNNTRLGIFTRAALPFLRRT